MWEKVQRNIAADPAKRYTPTHVGKRKAADLEKDHKQVHSHACGKKTQYLLAKLAF